MRMAARAPSRDLLVRGISLEQAAAGPPLPMCRHQRRNCRAQISQGSASPLFLPVAKIIAAD
jgi:hypothetical protein